MQTFNKSRLHHQTLLVDIILKLQQFPVITWQQQDSVPGSGDVEVEFEEMVWIITVANYIYD